MITFFDFEDSFSANIVAGLEDFIEVQFVELKDQSDYLNKINQNKKEIFCLGPGPGTPRDYELFQKLPVLYANPLKAFLGVCLGHQMIWQSLFQCSLVNCGPYHGVALKDKNGEAVQMYNSWKILPSKNLLNSSEDFKFEFDETNQVLLSGSSVRVHTYQFHPESIGTSCPQRVFETMRNFAYNFLYEEGKLTPRRASPIFNSRATPPDGVRQLPV